MDMHQSLSGTAAATLQQTLHSTLLRSVIAWYRYGDGTLRMTVEQDVLFPNVPEANVEAMQKDPLFQRWVICPTRSRNKHVYTLLSESADSTKGVSHCAIKHLCLHKQL